MVNFNQKSEIVVQVKWSSEAYNVEGIAENGHAAEMAAAQAMGAGNGKSITNMITYYKKIHLFKFEPYTPPVAKKVAKKKTPKSKEV